MASRKTRQERRRLQQEFEAKRAIELRGASARGLPPARIRIQPKYGDSVFVRRVRAAAANVPLEEAGGCPPHIARFLRWLRRVGPDEVINTLRAEAALKYDHHQDISNECHKPITELILYVGTRIFDQLPEAYRQQLLPDYFFVPVPSDIGVEITFGFLQKEMCQGKVVYRPPCNPAVVVNGVRWPVVLSRHAVERACERCSFDFPVPYAHYWRCEAYFRGYSFYEPVWMSDGQPAVRLYMSESVSGSPDRYSRYVHRVTGEDGIRGLSGVPAYVLGYCPLALIDGVAVAKSFLYPGYDGTPEDALVRTAAISRAERQQLLGLASGNNLMRTLTEDNHQAISWYHHNGVPQVVSLDRRLFNYDAAF